MLLPIMESSVNTTHTLSLILTTGCYAGVRVHIVIPSSYSRSRTCPRGAGVLDCVPLCAYRFSDNNNFYCQLAVDDEVVARTSVVWRASASPFFGEEFFIECRHNMQSLRYVSIDTLWGATSLHALSYSTYMLVLTLPFLFVVCVAVRARPHQHVLFWTLT